MTPTNDVRRRGASTGGATRVAVLRSSRFLPIALGAVRRHWPDAVIRVVHQPGTGPELAKAGIDESDRICYDHPAGYRLGAFVRSSAFRCLRVWRPDEVVVQWTTFDGVGQFRLSLVAQLVGGRRFWVVRRDGELMATTVGRLAVATVRRLVRLPLSALLVLGIVAATLVLTPLVAARRAWKRPRRPRLGPARHV